PAFFVGVPRAPAEVEGQLRRTIGDDGLVAFLRYTTELPMRLMTRQLAGALYATDTPLTAAQASQLVQVFADARRDAADDAQAWDASLAQARSFLPPVQFEALQNLRREEIYRLALIETQ